MFLDSIPEEDPPFPKGPCTSMVYTWDLRCFLYPLFGAHVHLDPALISTPGYWDVPKVMARRSNEGSKGHSFGYVGGPGEHVGY